MQSKNVPGLKVSGSVWYHIKQLSKTVVQNGRQKRLFKLVVKIVKSCSKKSRKNSLQIIFTNNRNKFLQ